MTAMQKTQKVVGRKRSAANTVLGKSISSGLLTFAFCILLSAFGLSAPAPTPATSNDGRQTYESFRLVHTRNVFDPDRRPVRPANVSGPTAATRTDYVALTGIALDGEKSLAFFSGSRAEFNMVIPAGSKVAGATVAKINPMDIEVDRKGRHLVIAVGQTVPLDDKSAPAAAPADQPAAAPAILAVAGNSPSTAVPNAGSAPGASPSTANLDEIRRRMMERHNQDQK